jgi:hypothetical protein
VSLRYATGGPASVAADWCFLTWPTTGLPSSAPWRSRLILDDACRPAGLSTSARWRRYHGHCSQVLGCLAAYWYPGRPANEGEDAHGHRADAVPEAEDRPGSV